MDWIYGQIVGFLGNFFALMGNMGVELFELEWVSAIILFFSRLAWALFAVSVVVCAFECGIEYSTGRGNLQQCGMNIIKGFLAVSLFTVVPVRLYALSVSLQGTFSAGLTGYGRSIGEVGQDIITELKEIQTLTDVVNSSHFGLGIITSPIMLLFCVILMGYAVLKVFFANLKRGGILLIQIAVGSLYMFSVPRGYLDGFMGWMRQVIGLCLTAFLQSTILTAIQGTLDDNNNRLRTILFKCAVELNMLCHTIAAHFCTDPIHTRELRAYAVDEVKRTNGQVSFENAVRSQRRIEPDDTWPGSY